ncbi:MAG TPA: Wzz/FepE/Etk N-terminal domain-containing protein [Gaiellaceae bacterium]|nr:Wzz/FepE/Etk N-terminal domain-containing protein [Gaiellaceae bacterium]
MIEQRDIQPTVARLHALDPPAEQPIDVQRYVNALRRSRVLIAAIVIGLTGFVLLLSLVLPKTYTAQSTILFDETPSATATTDAQRQLATVQKLLTTRDVLALSATKLNTSVSELSSKVHASVDPNANIVSISASASTPQAAARTANAVAAAFLARQRSVELARIQVAKTRLTNAIAQLAGTPGGKAQIPLLRARLGDLSASAATAGDELQLADRAQPPSKPTSPRPVRNAAFAFVAALFIAILVALGRERVAPRVGERRDLERLSGVPILTEIPEAGRGAAGAVAEREAFDVLAAVVQAQLPRQRQKILLVTSALNDKGKVKVTAGLSRALAQSGEAALVVDADLRRPSLEQLFGMERAPGLAEILAAARHGDTETAAGMIVEPPASASSRRRTGSLAVLGAGEAASPSLVSPDALQVLFDELGQSAFTFVVIHAPPLLEPEGCRAWAQHVDALIVVSRLEKTSPNDLVELRDQLEQVDTTVLGHVVLGRGKQA